MWHPAVDVYRTANGWILKFDLAGVRLDDIHVHVARRTVTVSGVRRDCLHETGCSHYSMEIRYSGFERTIELPDDLNRRSPGWNTRTEFCWFALRNERTQTMSEEAATPKLFPVLPLKNTVLFPYLLMPLSVGRSTSLAAVQAALGTEDKEIVLVAQKDPVWRRPLRRISIQ